MSGAGATQAALSFTLPPALEAHEPAEARGLARDEVRLMVSFLDDDRIVHTRFARIADFLRRGDVLVVNASATINAAIGAARPNGELIELHFSQQLPDDRWVVELRRIESRGTSPLLDAEPGEGLVLEKGGTVTLEAPYRPPSAAVRTGELRDGEARLWLAAVQVEGDAEGDIMRYLDRHGFPIRYGYVPARWPLSYYQTIFAREPGSAEMPSAGRAFTPRVLRALSEKGVAIVPVILHAGVASLEDHEPPYPEPYHVGAEAAAAVNDARRRGGRVVAVGTTVVRALETVAAPDGAVAPGSGWTDLVITPERGLRVVDALLTGLHEPRASHLAMLEALAGRQQLETAYAEALQQRYLWHEFGDLHLVLGS